MKTYHQSLLQRQIGKEDVVLQNVTNLPPQFFVEQLTVEMYGTALNRQTTGDGIQQCGFARTCNHVIKAVAT